MKDCLLVLTLVVQVGSRENIGTPLYNLAEEGEGGGAGRSLPNSGQSTSRWAFCITWAPTGLHLAYIETQTIIYTLTHTYILCLQHLLWRWWYFCKKCMIYCKLRWHLTFQVCCLFSVWTSWYISAEPRSSIKTLHSPSQPIKALFW